MSTSNFTSWVHCNSCYMYYNGKKLFSLVNCRHIFCRECLEKRVIQNDSQCPFCKKSVRYKNIDEKLEAHIKASLDPDAYTPLESSVKNLEMNIHQMHHLHLGFEKCVKLYNDYDKLEKAIDKEEQQIRSSLRKVLAQNKVLKSLIKEENEKKERVRKRQTPPKRLVLPPLKLPDSPKRKPSHYRPSYLMNWLNDSE